MDQQPPVQPPASFGEQLAPQGPSLAEWWKRLVAAILDSVIVVIPANILGGIIFAGLFRASVPRFDPQTGQLESAGFVGGILAAQGAFLLMFLVLTAAYYVYFHGSRGQTPGKMVMKIKVIDEGTGATISYGSAFLRWLVPQLGGVLTCGILTLLDGLWPLWDARRQAIHDKVAKSLVIDVL